MLLTRPMSNGLMNSAEFILPLQDLGSGAVDLSLGRGVGTATFTRATAAAAKLSTGLWKLDVASGTARSHYLGLNTAVGVYGGYLSEGQRTNSCLQSRDITNVAWAKVTLTTAKTSTGIDGVTNSCTSCTATGANSTALQAIVLASALKVFSIWIKRVTGTGNIFITLDNDATRTDVTALINSSTFTLVQMSQTLANPTVGFKIATSGDAIDVDVAQLEDGKAFASTPIVTTAAAVTRNFDELTYTLANIDQTVGGSYAEIAQNWTAGTNPSGAYIIGSSTGIALHLTTTPEKVSINDGATGSTDSSFTVSTTSVQKIASSWGGTTMKTFNGGAAGTGATFDGDLSLTGVIGINCTGSGGGSAQPFGTSKNIKILKRKPSDSALQGVTT
jgi:hypothetical protein